MKIARKSVRTDFYSEMCRRYWTEIGIRIECTCVCKHLKAFLIFYIRFRFHRFNVFEIVIVHTFTLIGWMRISGQNSTNFSELVEIWIGYSIQMKWNISLKNRSKFDGDDQIFDDSDQIIWYWERKIQMITYLFKKYEQKGSKRKTKSAISQQQK